MAIGMGNDIFGYKRSPKPHGVFSTEDSRLIFGAINSTGPTDVAGSDPAVGLAYLVQNWAVQYTQTVQELFELGSNALYWAKGRPAGMGQLGRVVGGAADSANSHFFPQEAFDICSGGALMKLEATGGHCDLPANNTNNLIELNKGVNLIMNGCIVTSIGFSMQVGDVRLLENFGWRFAYLQVQGSQE